MKKRRSNAVMGMSFFTPALILMIVFLFVPMILTVVYSFTDYFALSLDNTHFVGLEKLWMQIYSPEGIINTILGHLGIDAQPFIHSAKQVLPSIAFMSVWQDVGYQMIIFLGGLQAINPTLYEAAEMDHASACQKVKDITLPELKPLCIFVFITITIGAFRMIVQPMVMTGGGPSNSTYTLVYDIYETGKVNWEIGLSSAMAVVFVIILTIIQNVLTKDKEEKKK